MFKMYKLTVLILVLFSIDMKSTSESHRTRRESTASFGDFNYHASIRVEYDEFWIHHCSGAVLDDEHVVTAASCIYDLSPEDIKVVVGTGNNDPIFAADPWHPLNSVAHAYIHKKFNATFNRLTIFDYDIAIIRTEKSLQPQGRFSSISPVSPTINIPYEQHATMTLWNIVGASESSYNKLMMKRGYKTNDHQCGCVYSDFISPQMICYDFDEGCFGETGAPLSIFVEGSFSLIGIYSWHGNCINLTYPAVCTRISQFADWIESAVTYTPAKVHCKFTSF